MSSPKVRSLVGQGFSETLADIECHINNNLPNIIIVGIVDMAVAETKERLRGAFTNSRLTLPRKHITINLAPADIPKDGSSFDLRLAIACAKLTSLSSTFVYRPAKPVTTPISILK